MVVAQGRVPVAVLAVFEMLTGIDLVSIACPGIAHRIGRAPDVGIVRTVNEYLPIPLLRTVYIVEYVLET